jgi:hypothetical protein
VLVTRPVVERAGLIWNSTASAKLSSRGFSVSTEMFVARLSNEEE